MSHKNAKAPVAVFVYNRPDHAHQMLEALNDNEGADLTDLFIFADAAKNEDGQAAVDAVRKVIHDFTNHSRFASVTLREAKENLGLRRSIISGVTSVMEEYGRIIVVEDDLVCRKNFLKYMNDALDMFENDERIWSLAGHTRDFPELADYPYDFYLTRRACSWGWGMWKDRWDTIDWEVSDYDSFVHNPYRRWRYARGGADLFKMLDNDMHGKSNSWALRNQYSMAKTECFTIYPKHTFVYNIGLDGSGTHCTATKNDTVVTLEGEPYVLDPNLQFNARVNRGFLHSIYPNLYERGVRKLKKMLSH